MIEAKAKAPNFNSKDQFNADVSILDYRGKKIFMFFCPDVNDVDSRIFLTTYAKNYARFQNVGVEIVGIFGNDMQDLLFQSKAFGVPFPLLSDTDLTIRKAYGTWNKKITFGKEYWISTRCAVLIDEQGIIEKVFKQIHTDENGEIELHYMEHAFAKAKWRTLSRRTKERLMREYQMGLLEQDEMRIMIKALKKNW